MNEQKFSEDIVRAQKAKDILDNDLFSEAFTSLRQRCIDAWAASSLSDTRGHLELHTTVKVLDSLYRYFEKSINNGKVAEDELAYLAAARDLEQING